MHTDFDLDLSHRESNLPEILVLIAAFCLNASLGYAYLSMMGYL